MIKICTKVLLDEWQSANGEKISVGHISEFSQKVQITQIGLEMAGNLILKLFIL